MDINNFYNNLEDTKDNELKKLLNKILEIENPNLFTEDFATDKQLDEIEDMLDGQEVNVITTNKLMKEIKKVKPTKAKKVIFI